MLKSEVITTPQPVWNFSRRIGYNLGEVGADHYLNGYEKFYSVHVMAKQVWLVEFAKALARWNVPCLKHGLSSLFPIWNRRRSASESEYAYGLMRPSLCRKLGYRRYFRRFAEWLKHFKGRLYLRGSIVYDIGNNIVIIYILLFLQM